MSPDIIRYRIERIWKDSLEAGDVVAPDKKKLPVMLEKDLFETYSFILKYWEQKGNCPKVRKIVKGLKEKSTSTVNARVHKLADLGCIEPEFNENGIMINYSLILGVEVFELGNNELDNI